MKLMTWIALIVIIGLSSLTYLHLNNDLNDNYLDNEQINSSLLESYDYINEINQSISPLKEKFEVIADENKGFFTKIAAGIVAIPYAIILLPSLVLEGLKYTNDMIVQVSLILKVPPLITYGLLVLMMIFVISRLLEFFQRSEA